MIIKVLIKVFDKSVFVLLSEKFFILRHREEILVAKNFLNFFWKIFFRSAEIRLPKTKNVRRESRRTQKKFIYKRKISCSWNYSAGFFTLSMYFLNPSTPRSNMFTNLVAKGGIFFWCMPRASCITSTWPSV